jgi:hypothetical protein
MRTIQAKREREINIGTKRSRKRGRVLGRMSVSAVADGILLQAAIENVDYIRRAAGKVRSCQLPITFASAYLPVNNFLTDGDEDSRHCPEVQPSPAEEVNTSLEGDQVCFGLVILL